LQSGSQKGDLGWQPFRRWLEERVCDRRIPSETILFKRSVDILEIFFFKIETVRKGSELFDGSKEGVIWRVFIL